MIQVGEVVREMAERLGDAWTSELPTRAEVDRAKREERLAFSRAALASSDRAALVDDTQGDTPALALVRRFHALVLGAKPKDGRPMQILALFGPPGVGKTVAASWLLARELGQYTTIAECTRVERANYGPDRDRWEQLLRTRVLVIDDVGPEPDAQVQRVMFELVNQRLARWTVITGNVTAEQWRTRYDARTTQRVDHVGRVCEVGGESMRRGPA